MIRVKLQVFKVIRIASDHFLPFEKVIWITYGSILIPNQIINGRIMKKMARIHSDHLDQMIRIKLRLSKSFGNHQYMIHDSRSLLLVDPLDITKLTLIVSVFCCCWLIFWIITKTLLFLFGRTDYSKFFSRGKGIRNQRSLGSLFCYNWSHKCFMLSRNRSTVR